MPSSAGWGSWQPPRQVSHTLSLREPCLDSLASWGLGRGRGGVPGREQIEYFCCVLLQKSRGHVVLTCHTVSLRFFTSLPVNEDFEVGEIQMQWETKVKKKKIREGSQATEASNLFHSFPKAVSRADWPFDILEPNTHLEISCNFFAEVFMPEFPES